MNRSSEVFVQNFFIDKTDLESRVKIIEKSLEPFIAQILEPNPKFSAQIKKGQSRNVHNLVRFLNESIQNFLLHSQEISKEFPSIQNQLNAEIDRVKSTGNEALRVSDIFARDPVSSSKRKEMGLAQRDLLNAVARLLSIADMIDEFSVVRIVDKLQKIVSNMKNAKKEDEFLQHYKGYAENLKDLLNLSHSKQDVNFKLSFKI
jgi:hypothetical protein